MFLTKISAIQMKTAMNFRQSLCAAAHRRMWALLMRMLTGALISLKTISLPLCLQTVKSKIIMTLKVQRLALLQELPLMHSIKTQPSKTTLQPLRNMHLQKKLWQHSEMMRMQLLLKILIFIITTITAITLC